MDVSIDTRTIQAGQTFIPVKGPNFDGKDFIADAVKKGATVLDVDLGTFAKKYRKKLTASVIGVTGSAGKTTVKDLLASVLSQKFCVSKSKENENNDIGVPLTVLRADAKTEILIVEMAMRNKGEIKKLSQIVRPDHVIITGAGLSHIENLKTPRNIALAKAEIFLDRSQWERQKRVAFLNHAGGYYELLKEKAERAGFAVLPFGGTTKPDQNINLVYLVGRHFGLSNDEISAGIKAYTPSSHRLIKIPLKRGLLIDDSYNANPDGMTFALQTLAGIGGRKILVLGDMLELGSFAKKAHKDLVPQAVDAGIELIFSVGEQSKNLSSKKLQCFHFKTLKQLNKALVMEIKDNDTILVKGSRGMGMEKVVDHLRETLA